MEPQSIINVLGGVVICGMGWHLSTLHKRVHEQAKENAALKVLVAGKYVTREELERFMQAIFAKLDCIEDRMDRKADKKEVS